MRGDETQRNDGRNDRTDEDRAHHTTGRSCTHAASLAQPPSRERYETRIRAIAAASTADATRRGEASPAARRSRNHRCSRSVRRTRTSRRGSTCRRGRSASSTSSNSSSATTVSGCASSRDRSTSGGNSIPGTYTARLELSASNADATFYDAFMAGSSPEVRSVTPAAA
jgi:hypothetical protein